ncbi:hypothetical protein D9758_017463 [Tetrapyrgos nigripes]|uniref:Nephrocystin 3-like N-terminal domain-containing protein n=1 Tax=Tetrapyrgos nigripes TaxID=182062 RepID=A0A8H5C3C3_9AGAR|nr:hypothetical protein D9758_017463 [Tetrapyrgos nigripes]
MKRAFKSAKGKFPCFKKKGKKAKKAGRKTNANALRIIKRTHAYPEGNQVESNQSQTDSVNRPEVVKSVDNVEANERKLEDTPVISSDNTLDNVAATPAASIHQTTHSEDTGTALTPAESINQAMHPEGVRMNAGGNTYNWNNVQGNQTQNINNDNRNIINSNNNAPKFRNGLMLPNPSVNFNAAYNKMTKGTGVWLLEDSRFNEWKDEGGLLWLQGKAGSGKTFLCTKAIFSIGAEHQVVYFYFDTLDQTKSKGTYQGMLSSLMLDVGLQSDWEHIKDLYKQNNEGRIKMRADVMKATLLKLLVQKPSTTCIFIDAMDECQASDQHLVSRLILDLLELGSKIHMFVSCRHTASTVGISSATHEISLNEQVVESDIQRHIEQVFQDRPLSVDVHKEVTEALAHGAHGQIRWVDCQIQQLQELGTRTAILNALKNLPDDLEETYCQALVRVNKHHQKDVEAILKWLLFGYEELKLELLPEILRVNIKQQILEDTQTIPTSGLSKIISSTLVIVQVQEVQGWWERRARKEHVLQLAHPSVKEYILSETILQSSAQLFHVNDQLAHKFIAQLCMIYLVVCGKDGSIDGEKFPLAKYAAHQWPEHVRNLHLMEDPVKSLSLHLFTDTNKSCLAWIQQRYHRRTFGSALPLYYASMANLLNVIVILVEEGANVNAQGGEWGNALQAALHWGRSEVARLLLEKGADINAQGGLYGNALQAASYWGREEIVKLLVEKGADINAQGGQYGNALQAASNRGREEIVKLLVEKGADINAQGGQYGNALQAAAVSYWGREEIVKLLVEKGADINAQGGQYDNALYAASYKGREKIVKLLVEKGADINAQGGRYGNALQVASYEGREGIVKLLVEKGADINAQGGPYGNALQAASYEGREGIVKLLVEKGADINAQGGQYGNALQAASYMGREEIVKLLVEKGADINSQGGFYGNALQAAAASYGGREEIVKLLVEKGADINAQGGPCGNALQAASYMGREEIVKLLVEKGADINAQGGEYGNALQAASYGEREEIVKLLVEKGADINAQGGQYGNALQAAAASYGGSEEIVKLLVEKGADINAQGGQYGNALQVAAASYWGKEEIVKLLVEKGADINAQGGQYGNALYAASYVGSEEIVKLLVEKGADINAQGGEYGNALQAASYEGREEIVKLLVENGADINSQGGSYGNALQAASYEGREEIVKLLVEKGADINAQGGYHGNALQAASYGGETDIVKFLVEKGANVNIEGGKYGTALQAACVAKEKDHCDHGFDYLKQVEILINNGADINSRAGRYGSPIQAAAFQGNQEIFDLLMQRGAAAIDPIFTVFQEDPKIPFPLMDNEPADHHIYCPVFWNM